MLRFILESHFISYIIRIPNKNDSIHAFLFTILIQLVRILYKKYNLLLALKYTAASIVILKCSSTVKWVLGATYEEDA